MGLNWINRQDSPARSVALGTFDGVHLGHQKLLEEALARTPAGGTSSVLTFDIPPEQHFRGDLRLLTTFQRRVELFRSFGIHEVAWFAFGPELTSMEADYFVEKILVGEMQAKEIVCGYDYGFGKGRAGDAEYLLRQGQHYGFSVTIVPPVQEGGEPISSTTIRRLLSEGDLAQVVEYLGYYPTYQAAVEQMEAGQNFRLQLDSALVLPVEGVYLLWCLLAPGEARAAIAWPEGTGKLGVFWLDADPLALGDQKVLEVQLLTRLREDEDHGPSESDVLKARELLAGFCLQDARVVLK